MVNNLLRSAGRRSGPVPVEGTVDGTPIRATVVKYQGAWRLYLNLEFRRAARVGIDDVVDVSLRFDPKPRVLPIPAALRGALARNSAAKAKWERLAPSHRKESLAYLNALKTKASLGRNVRKTLRRLLEG